MIIVIGVSNLFADAFSMASADFLSEDSKNNLNNPEKKNQENFKNAFITFFSFIFIGSFPLAPSIFGYFLYGPNIKIPFSIFLISIITTILAFTIIGYLRGKILLRNKIKTITQSILICSTSASVAYFLGEYIANLLI